MGLLFVKSCAGSPELLHSTSCDKRPPPALYLFFNRTRRVNPEQRKNPDASYAKLQHYATGVSREDLRQEELRAKLPPDVSEEVIVQHLELSWWQHPVLKFTANNKRTR